MKRILASLAFCIMLAAIAGPVLSTGTAVESIGIQPVSPDVWDDLTCHATVTDASGSLDRVRFSWLRNGVGIRYFEDDVSGFSASVSDMLDSSLTKEGDQIRCRVEAFGAYSSHDSLETSVIVKKTSQNSPPIISGIPDLLIEIGDNAEADLWEFATDPDDEDSALEFSLASQGNTDIIECWISGDRFLFCGPAKQLGETSLTVRVTDPKGAWDSDTFTIKVTSGVPFPDNNPPSVEFVDIDPNSPEDRDDLTCETRVSDDDGNLDNVEFRWYVDGRLERVRTDHVSGFVDTATDVLSYSETDENDDVECRVTVEDTDGEEGTGSRSVRVEEEDSDTCRIAVRDIEISDGEDIEFVIRNTGDLDADVDYRIYVDGDRVETDDIDVDEDDSERVMFRWFGFEEGETYNIRVRAEADCGQESDTDESSVYYTVLDVDDCDSKWLESYRCSGDWVQRLYREPDCDTAWRSWKHCTYGCSSGACLSQGYPGTPTGTPSAPSQGCSFAIDSFSSSQSISSTGTGYVEAVVRNTGSRTQDFDMDIYLDGSYLGTRSFILIPGASTKKVWNFNAAAYGTHRVSIVVSSDCGSVQARESVIGQGYPGTQPPGVCNYNGVCESGEGFLSCPYDCPEPGPAAREPTSVGITPESLDVPLYKSKVITIDIGSSVPQDFRISVAGVPESWVSFKDTVSVEGDMFAYVFVNPRERGQHEVTVSVFASREGLTFSKKVSMFVTESDGSGAPQGDFLTGFGAALASNVWAIIIIIIIAAAALVLFSYRYLRDEDDVRFADMEKRDVLTS